MSEPAKKPTIGERRVRTTFNPSLDSQVDNFKQKSAHLIDLVSEVKPKDDADTDTVSEVARLKALAMTHYEAAAMYAVKAATA